MKVLGKVYGLLDPDSHKVRYIGQTVRDLRVRLAGHICSVVSDRPVVLWVKGLVSVGKRPDIVLLGEADTHVALDTLEQRMIAEYRAAGNNLLNKSSGGGGRSGMPLSKEHRAKLHNAEVWAKAAETKRGKPSPKRGSTLSLATKAKISANRTGKTAGASHPLFRHDVNDERILTMLRSGRSTTEVGSELGVDRHTVRLRILKLRASGADTPALCREVKTTDIISALGTKSKQQVAVEFNISVACIWDRLKKAELAGQTVPRAKRICYEDVARLTGEGITIIEVAFKLETSKDVIRWHLKRSSKARAHG